MRIATMSVLGCIAGFVAPVGTPVCTLSQFANVLDSNCQGKSRHPNLQTARQASVVSAEVDRRRFVLCQPSRQRTNQTMKS
ncbi:MAG: hypothetical protein KDB00_11295, partial [Planctomycetales bacterium]|nr:hypothetical protein [Planctomycetales bacterium]